MLKLKFQYFHHLMQRTDSLEKDPDVAKDWRQEEKGPTEDEMVGWHHRLNGQKFEKALGVGEGQGGLVCCSPWGHKESDTSEWVSELNWIDRIKHTEINLPKKVKSFHGSSAGKEFTCNAGGPGSIPGSGRSTREGIGYTLQYSWASLVAKLVKNLPVMWDTCVRSLACEIPCRRDQLPTPVIWPGDVHRL